MRYFLSIIFFVAAVESHGQEYKLWYKEPAVKWTEALPIGNGRLGAMIFGGVESDRIQFNEETLWTGEPRDYTHPGAALWLDSIRNLLFAGKQKEAEQLAELHFMGSKSNQGKKEEWFKKVRAVENLNGDPSSENFDDSKWEKMWVPSFEGWEAVGFEGLDGAVWLRTTFELPTSWKGQNVVLDLNRIRDQDFTYVNGHLAGSMDNNDPRKYVLRAEWLHPGKNQVAIQVLNYGDKGGITGYKDTTRTIGLYREGADEKEKITINGLWKYFIQDDEPAAVGRYQADYQPFGDLHLNFLLPGAATSYKRELDISKAIASTSFTSGSVNYYREYLSSQPHQLIAIKLFADKKGMINFEAVLSSPHKKSNLRQIDEHTIAINLAVRNGVLTGESWLQIKQVGGTLVIKDGKIIVSNADAAEICLSAATSYKNYQDVLADPGERCRFIMGTSAAQSYNQIKAIHLQEYQKYYNKFFIEFGKSKADSIPTNKRIEKFSSSPDPAFAALYLQYGRYLLIASSRPGTRPANLQGIWNDLLSPPWGSKYTTNINAEMNYWPAELLNLSDLHEPLFKMIEELSITGSRTALVHYNAPGWVLHHNTDLWRGTAPINAANHGIWVTGGAWLCLHLWEHYQYTQDLSFLKKYYPILKGAARFFNYFLVKDPKTGWLISTPSNSPEQGGLVAGPTMDHQIIRNLFSNVIEAGRLLNVDQQFCDSLRNKLPKIAPNMIGRYGQLQEWMEDKDDSSNRHRHVSHLWALYPGNEINQEETPGLVQAAKKSLLFRGDAATGWSLGWKINFWARLLDGDHAYRMVTMLLSPAKGGAGSYPNLFDAHPPFQIDGNFGGAAGIGEMLIQSHTKYIDLLPALPAALHDGKVKGLCARGGFEINMEWKKGKLYLIELISKQGKECHLRYGKKLIQLRTEKNKTYRFNGELKLAVK